MLTRLTSRYRLSMLSGDRADQAFVWRAWFSAMTFNQSPADKLDSIHAAEAAGDHVLMVGDGLNDAGALAAAEVGMAVSDDTACLVPACDAMVRGDRLAMLPEFLAYARRARRVIVLCFVVSLAYNVVGLTLALRGDLTPLVTAILMPVSSLTIIGLSVGLMRWRAPEAPPA
jgi:P-type Cu+ transporter